MENTIKRIIAIMMIFLISFSVVTYVGSNDFTASAATAKAVSIKKKPTVKASKIKATSVKLKWSKTKGATSYRVYKSTDKKKWTFVTKTKKTSYTAKKLNGNKKYYFRVRAYKITNGKTTKSPYSKIITVMTKKEEPVSIYTTSYYDGSYCLDCGSKDCEQSMRPYFCVVCKKTIQALECHSKAHHKASH